MNNLAGLVLALDQCRFYVENMVQIQFGKPLQSCPAEPPHNKSINDRNLHRMVPRIEKAFNNAVLNNEQFPVAAIIYRFRSLRGLYSNRYADYRTEFDGNMAVNGPWLLEREGMTDHEWCRFFLKYTADQVRSFIYMVCLDQYAREQTDHYLPQAPFVFDEPESETVSAYLNAHHTLINDLMMALLNTHSDRLDIHPSLRKYGTDVMLPLTAKCLNLIYEVMTIDPRIANIPPAPKEEDEMFEPIPESEERTFEQQAEWEKAATEIAQSFGLQAFVDESDSAFVLIPRVYRNADDLTYWSEGRLTGLSVLDIAVSPIQGQTYLDLEVMLRSVGKTIRERAIVHDCHVIARYIEHEDQIIGAVLRVRRNVDFPASPKEIMTHVELQ